MKKFDFKKRIGAFAMSAVMFVSLAFSGLYAAEPIVTPSKPNAWSIPDLITYSAYGVNVEFADYRGTVSLEDFKGIVMSLAAALGEAYPYFSTPSIPTSAPVTVLRGDVIRELYGVIATAFKLDTGVTEIGALDYFVGGGLISGRVINGKIDYSLQAPATTEETLVFAKRVYEYVKYGRGEFSSGMFWKVSDEDNTVYLLGSIHMTDGSFFPLSKGIMAGFADSAYLAVEADLRDATEGVAYAAQKAVYADGSVIGDHISADLYKKYIERMTEVVEAYPTLQGALDYLKPWYATTLLETLSASENNGLDQIGIDAFFLALLGAREIIELESAKFQIDMIDSYSDGVQELMLASTIYGSDQSAESLASLVKAWKSGDARTVERLVEIENTFGDSEIDKQYSAYIDEYVRKMYTDRNAGMLVKVKKMLTEDSKNNYFVVVGAAHMVTDSGIVKGLRDAGYKVEQVTK